MLCSIELLNYLGCIIKEKGNLKKFLKDYRPCNITMYAPHDLVRKYKPLVMFCLIFFSFFVYTLYVRKLLTTA